VLTVLLVSSYGSYSEVSSQYDTQAAELARLQALQPFPNQANLDATQQRKDEYQAKLNDLLKSLSERTVEPVDNVSPNGFQDMLRDTVSRLTEAARERGVTLPENFYLGFDAYQSGLPRGEAAAPLARQLKAVEFIVGQLIDKSVTEIKAIERPPLPEEGGASASRETSKRGTQQEPERPSVVEKSIVNVSFRTQPSQLRRVMNALSDAQTLVIVRTLQVKNDKPVSPSRSEDPFSAPVDALSPDGSAAPVENRMSLVFGDEKLDVSLRVEIVNFSRAEIAPAEQGADR
jgi:hypothetical protein